MSDPAAFLILTGSKGDPKISLDDGSAWMIGRTSQHPIVLADELVSRNHAMIQSAHPGEYYLIDMGSRNGSYVNGVRVSIPRKLCDGDSIAIGESTMSFHCGTSGGKDLPEAKPPEGDQTRASFAARLLTVMVVDIRDFTRLAQQVEQKVLSEAIGTWFRLGGKIVQEHGSWTQKYIGDAIMSVWLHFADGRPEVLPVVQAYLELVGVTAELGKQFALPNPLRIGGGINTGVAIVGNTGSVSMSDFTAMGDTVNAAFRLESATKETGSDLVVGQRTYDLLRSLAVPDVCFYSHVVTLKGYDEPATVWAADLDSLRNFVRAASAKSG